jgi:hypothetical protein
VPLDLARVRAELSASSLVSPYPVALAAAIVADVWRLAGLRPILVAEWEKLRGGVARPAGESPANRLEGQLGMLAHVLAETSLRDVSVAALAASKVAMGAALTGFFAEIAPLEAEMIRSNAFRQEELLRWWMRALGGDIAGETAADSAARLAKLDYKRTLVEYQAAEKARADEAEKRAQALKEAAEREAEARGWRE